MSSQCGRLEGRVGSSRFVIAATEVNHDEGQDNHVVQGRVEEFPIPQSERRDDEPDAAEQFESLTGSCAVVEAGIHHEAAMRKTPSARSLAAATLRAVEEPTKTGALISQALRISQMTRFIIEPAAHQLTLAVACRAGEQVLAQIQFRTRARLSTTLQPFPADSES
jgi:hypothetical protein